MHAKTPVPPFGDSVLPIVEAKQAEIARDEYQIGDHARILPTPGHTPGHVAFTFGRGKDDAVFCGDLMHSPLQTRYPELSVKFDVDQAQAATRGAISWSAIATPTRCAAPRISPRRRPGKSAAPATDFPARRYELGRSPVSKPCRWNAVDEHVTIVRLNRPDASNALNTQMGRDLVRCFEDVALDPGESALHRPDRIGDKAFCAGGDLKERRGMTDEQWTRQHVIFERMVRALIDCPVPIIGAVNGAAYGGGCEIAALAISSTPPTARALPSPR